MSRKLSHLALAVGASLVAGSAAASSCGSLSSYNIQYHSECNPAASSQLISGATFGQMDSISQAIGLRQNAQLGGGPVQLGALPQVGMAAGGPGSKWNAWGNVSNNQLDYSNRFAGTNIGYDGSKMGTVLGADYRLNSQLTLGLSLAYDDATIKQKANDVKQANRGYNLAPYFAYQINRDFSIDGTLGMGWGDLSRTSKTVPAYHGDTDRIFGGINLNHAHWFDKLQIAGKASVLYSHQHNGDATGGLSEATKYLAQGRLGVQAGYWVGNGWMPYASLTYANDFARNSTAGINVDRDGFIIGLGANYLAKGDLSGGVALTSEVGRDHVTNNVFMANINLRF